MNLVIIAGARPNFMKIAPIIHEIKRVNNSNESDQKIDFELIHTGQHYDKKLSQQFFEDLNIPKPSINLEVGSGTHAHQTAKIMVAFEDYLQGKKVDWVIVVGDVNSTMACTIVSKKLGIKVAHVEAGLRSHDMEMPEEINRLVTDAICDRFYTTSHLASMNLEKRGINKNVIEFVGNTMIDTLIANQSRFTKPNDISDDLIQSNSFLLVTLHRPSNVDDPTKIKRLLNLIKECSSNIPVIFPVHPRTKKMIDQIGDLSHDFHFTEPLPYLNFMYLVQNAKAVVTDSGGIQEETTFLNVPCLTLRENTERPETIQLGSNRLLGSDEAMIREAFNDVHQNQWPQSSIPKFWDGKTSQRIIADLLKITDQKPLK